MKSYELLYVLQFDFLTFPKAFHMPNTNYKMMYLHLMAEFLKHVENFQQVADQ